MDSSAPLFLRTFGSSELLRRVDTDDAFRLVLGPGKPLGLLAYCQAHPTTSLARRRLVDLFWGDTPLERRRQNIRQAIYRLRQIDEGVLDSADEESVRIGQMIQSDRDLVLHAIEQKDLDAILTWYRGPYLADISFPGGDEFEDWAEVERERLERRVIQTARAVLLAPPAPSGLNRHRAALEQLLQVIRPSAPVLTLGIEAYLMLDDGAAAQRLADQLEATVDGGQLTTDVRALLGKARAWEAPSEVSDSGIRFELTGRDAVFAKLVSAWRTVAQGVTKVVVLGGPAGIGKTRLLQAFSARLRHRHAAVAMVRATTASRHIPFSVAADVAVAMAELPGAAGIHAESARELAALDPRLAGRFNVAASASLDGEALRRRGAALLDLLEATAEQEPIALLLDDLHWCDPESRKVLESALTKSEQLPLLVVATARGTVTDWLPHPNKVDEHLLPLMRDECLDALRTCGSWPATEDVDTFLRALVELADGVPHDLLERLTLAVEQGVIGLSDGVWSSPDWHAAAHAIAVSSPLDHRLMACTPVERCILLALAVYGDVMTPALIEQSAWNGRPQDRSVDQLLASLETKQLLVRHDVNWQLGHDLIGERLIALSTPAELDQARQAVVRGLRNAGTTDALTRAVRLAAASTNDDLIAVVVREFMAAFRAIGDRRHASDLLASILGTSSTPKQIEALVHLVPWRLRRVDAFSRMIWTAGAAVAGAGAVFTFWAQQPAALVAIQAEAKLIPSPQNAPTTRRLMPAIQVRSMSPQSKDVVVRAELVGSGRILLGETAVTNDSGIATFSSLRFRLQDTAITLRFSADGHRATELSIADVGHAPNTLRLAGGMLANQRFTKAGDTIRVEPGAPIDGIMQLRYTTSWTAANVLATVVPTWGDVSSAWSEPVQLPTPVQNDVSDIEIRLAAPRRTGLYWVLLAMDAEDRGGFIASGTNWLMRTPVWGDGNDLALLPDSTLTTAIAQGYIELDRAYPIDHQLGRVCIPRKQYVSTRMKYCSGMLWLTGFRVQVIP